MIHLNGIRVGPRLLLGFGVMIALLLITLMIGLSRMAMIQGNLDQIVKENYAKITLINTMRDSVRFRGIALRDMVLQEDFGFKRNESKLMNEARQAYQQAADSLEKLLDNEGEKALFEAIRTADQTATDGLNQVVDASLSDDNATAQALLRDSIRGQQRGLIKALEAMLGHLVEDSTALAAQAEKAYRSAVIMTVSLGLLSVLAGAALAWGITRSLTGRLDKAVHIAQRIAAGDLTGKVNDNGKDELAILLRSLDDMNSALSNLIGHVSESAHQVTRSATDLSGSTQAVASLADDQSQQVMQVSASMEQMGVSIAEVAEDAAAVATSANKARDVAIQGNQNMQQSVVATERIVESVSQSSTAIDELRQQIEQISNVTQVIRDIADQTNLLALNAAIEAARAGEQGRGFAVVADEVRKLAERTSASTLSITETVTSVSDKTTQVVGAMAKVSADVNENAQISQVTRKQLDEIVAAATDVNRLIQHIAGATQEQTRASHETAASMERISQISERNSATMHELDDAARQLSGTANTLQSLVERFKLR